MKIVVPEATKHLVRKLTPRECWRLMGFTDSDFDKAQAVCSDTQLYKQAGNSIVVQVLEAIFRELLKQRNILKKGGEYAMDKRRKEV